MHLKAFNNITLFFSRNKKPTRGKPDLRKHYSYSYRFSSYYYNCYYPNYYSTTLHWKGDGT